MHKTILPFIAATIAFTPGPAAASETFREAIPASACRMANADDIGKAELVDGSWLVGAAVQNDDIELLCPVRISPFYMTGNVKTGLRHSGIGIMARDPDAGGSNTWVLAELHGVHRASTVATFFGDILSGNATTDAWSEGLLDAFPNFMLDVVLWIDVTMHQGTNNGVDRVRFSQVMLLPLPPG